MCLVAHVITLVAPISGFRICVCIVPGKAFIALTIGIIVWVIVHISVTSATRASA